MRVGRHGGKINSQMNGRSSLGLYEAQWGHSRWPGMMAPSIPCVLATQQLFCALSPPGSLDNSSPVTSKSEAFFSKLQEFREANKEECICSDPE